MPSLAQIEQELAARCGPFALHTVASGTTTTVTVAALTSSIALGGETDRWLLRRSASAVGDR
ncbi:MAG TPA: hypothetical protein VKB80_03245, partial [Kofleriaceae bacterium]|nr:hypothetical protein [Kofleriaceae bacterium]